MTKTNINLVLSQELLDRIDEARGDVPRVRWVRRAIESALGLGPEPSRAATAPRESSRVRSSAEARRFVRPNPKGSS